MSWTSDLNSVFSWWFSDINEIMSECFPILNGFLAVLTFIFVVVVVLKIVKNLPIISWLWGG